MKTKIFILTITTIMILTSISSAMSEGFTDVTEGKWFYESVTNMSEIGIIKGYQDNTFKPNDTVTYAEFVKMFIVAVTGEDLGNSSTGHWAENYYNKAIELGLFTEADITKKQLNEGIPRQSMALLIANNFKGVKVENYDLIQESIRDLELSKYYQHEIIKAYGLGILTGYPDGTYQPDSTLTRAESTTVINRILNEDQRVKPTFTNVGKDDYWKNDPEYDELVEWIANNQRGVIFGGRSYMNNGKIHFETTDVGGDNWTADDANYPKLHEHVYLTLKAYYHYAIEHDMGISIGGMCETNEITIGLRENTTTTNTLFFFGFAGTPDYLADTYASEPNYVPAYVFFEQQGYFTGDNFLKYGEKLFTNEMDRIGDTSLVNLNRNIFKELYGEIIGNKIMDYTLQTYKDSFNPETKDMINLPNSKVNIEGINIFYFDDLSFNAFYMDQAE